MSEDERLQKETCFSYNFVILFSASEFTFKAFLLLLSSYLRQKTNSPMLVTLVLQGVAFRSWYDTLSFPVQRLFSWTNQWPDVARKKGFRVGGMGQGAGGGGLGSSPWDFLFQSVAVLSTPKWGGNYRLNFSFPWTRAPLVFPSFCSFQEKVPKWDVLCPQINSWDLLGWIRRLYLPWLKSRIPVQNGSQLHFFLQQVFKHSRLTAKDNIFINFCSQVQFCNFSRNKRLTIKVIVQSFPLANLISKRLWVLSVKPVQFMLHRCQQRTKRHTILYFGSLPHAPNTLQQELVPRVKQVSHTFQSSGGESRKICEICSFHVIWVDLPGATGQTKTLFLLNSFVVFVALVLSWLSPSGQVTGVALEEETLLFNSRQNWPLTCTRKSRWRVF